jgi:hypothetical protein
MGWFLSILIACVALASLVRSGKKGNSRTRQGSHHGSVIHGYDGGSNSSDSGSCDSGSSGSSGSGGCDGGGF